VTRNHTTSDQFCVPGLMTEGTGGGAATSSRLCRNRVISSASRETTCESAACCVCRELRWDFSAQTRLSRSCSTVWAESTLCLQDASSASSRCTTESPTERSRKKHILLEASNPLRLLQWGYLSFRNRGCTSELALLKGDC
jgi:hypothetical protein